MMSRMALDSYSFLMDHISMGHLQMDLYMEMAGTSIVRAAITKAKSGTTLQKEEGSSSMIIRAILMLDSG